MGSLLALGIANNSGKSTFLLKDVYLSCQKKSVKWTILSRLLWAQRRAVLLEPVGKAMLAFSLCYRAWPGLLQVSNHSLCFPSQSTTGTQQCLWGDLIHQTKKNLPCQRSSNWEVFHHRKDSFNLSTEGELGERLPGDHGECACLPHGCRTHVLFPWFWLVLCVLDCILILHQTNIMCIYFCNNEFLPSRLTLFTLKYLRPFILLKNLKYLSQVSLTDKINAHIFYVFGWFFKCIFLRSIVWEMLVNLK